MSSGRPALVSLAAGASQVPLIRAARARGLEVVGVDRDASAAGLPLCAAHVAASTHDAEEVLVGLRALEGFDVRGVVARSSGPPVETAAHVARALGLPGLDPDVASRAVSKSGQRDLARAAGLTVPAAVTVSPGIHDSFPGVAPWVAKPHVTRVGKLAIRLVESPRELASAILAASEASEDGLVELESFVPGRDVVVAGSFTDSRWTTRATLEEDTRFSADGSATGLGLATPAELDRDEHAELDRALGRLIAHNQFGTGVAFATFRVARGAAPTFLELHLDLGGDYVVDGLLAEQGWNELAVELATGITQVEAAHEARPKLVRFLFASDDGTRFQRLTKASKTARVVLDRLGGVGPWDRVGYFLETTEGIEGNRRWKERFDDLLQRSP